MKLRLRADLILDPTDPVVNTIKDFLITNKNHFLKISNQETSRVIVEKCHHDETPPQPCEQIFKWEQTQ